MQRELGYTQRHEGGQTLLMFVLFIIVLFVFVGLGVDLGFAYIAKARLSKAVDAACLMAVRNISAGQNTAAAVATNAFSMNYGAAGNTVAAPVPSIIFSNDANNNVLVDVAATVSIKTYFIRVAGWKTLAVGSSAEATRAKLIMTLVLDRSHSMIDNGGAAAMPGVVTNFISLFDDTRDHVALVTFASTPAVDVPMAQPFKAGIINAVQTIYGSPGLVAGATFSQGGLTNALVQNQTVPIAPGDNVVKVTVFFTDGLANSIQDTLSCPSSTLKDFGGLDSGNGYCLWSPVLAENNQNNVDCADSTCSAAKFPSKQTSPPTMVSLTRANITAEGEFRSEQVADDMRANNTIVYAVGLGNAINAGFLEQIANVDGVRDPAKPEGLALIAPAASDLQSVFQRVADDILLRLTQ